MSLSVIFSTKKINNDFIEVIKSTSGVHKIEVLPYENPGKYSLTEVYNIGLEKASNNIVVFCHDDIKFDTVNWGRKLLNHFKRNKSTGIVGVAGTSYMGKTGKWWDVPSQMVGQVYHENEGKRWLSSYSKNIGNKLYDVVLVDGLFFGINKSAIKNNFNEDVKGFHFYDVDFCFTNYLNGVSLGVCTDIKITHLSIGMTNNEWDQNRLDFAEKYKNELPVAIKTPEVNTFIFVHDQEIVKQYNKHNKFSMLGDFTYVFVGYGDYSEIEHLDNVIIACDLEHNLESYPKFTAFTGWYALWKNKLIPNDNPVLLLEYDVILVDDFTQHLLKPIDEGASMIGFTPFPMSNYHFIDNSDWVKTVNDAIIQVYRTDVVGSLKPQIVEATKNNATPMWMSTNNIFMSNKVFNDYLSWFEPLIDLVKYDENIDHGQERCLTFYPIINKIPYSFLPGILTHSQLDSHKTQGHDVNYDESLKKLISNEK